jgi:hypothetical protein
MPKFSKLIREEREVDTYRDGTFVVSLVVPAGVEEDDMVEYISSAVRAFKGGFHPQDPIRQLNRDTVTVQTGKEFYADYKRGWSDAMEKVKNFISEEDLF